MRGKGFGHAVDRARFVILVLMLVAGLAHLAYDSMVNMVSYSKVEARVERVAVLCRPSGRPIEEAVDCGSQGFGRVMGKMIEDTVVYVSYRSPADGSEHQGKVVPFGKSELKRVRQLRPGDAWMVLAHDADPLLIKMTPGLYGR
jgi:hypothetical protein